MPTEKIKEVCEKVLPKEVCDIVEKAIKDKGIEIAKEPKTVVRPEPIIKDGKIDGGKIVIEVNF